MSDRFQICRKQTISVRFRSTIRDGYDRHRESVSLTRWHWQDVTDHTAVISKKGISLMKKRVLHTEFLSSTST